MSVFLLLTLHLTPYTIYLFPFERPRKLIGAQGGVRDAQVVRLRRVEGNARRTTAEH